jgi:hypothetical protein
MLLFGKLFISTIFFSRTFKILANLLTKKSPLLKGMSFFIRRESGSFSAFSWGQRTPGFSRIGLVFLRNWKKEVD